MKRKEIEEKYFNLYMLLDLDWHGYVVLRQLEREELEKYGYE